MNLQHKLEQIIETIRTDGISSHQSLLESAEDLLHFREKENSPGLCSPPKVMVTATLDDGLGQGLKIIHLFARAAGVILHPLGLLQPKDRIVSACHHILPDFLGMTVLQFDTEEDVRYICANLPPSIQVIAGGPVFKADKNLAHRVGIDFVARDVSDFLSFLIENS